MPGTKNPIRKINLNLPVDLLASIEEAAKAQYCTRSDYIRAAIVQRLDRQQITAASPTSTPSSSQESKVSQATAPLVVAPQFEDEFLEALIKHYADPLDQ
jgi:Arc/MetJ-type ribon-helix-helix transcriptional regulator